MRTALAVVLTLGLATPSTARAQDAHALTTGISLGAASVGYASLALGAGALASGDFGTAAGAGSLGTLTLVVSSPVAAVSSGARARKLGASPALSSAALGCMAGGLGSVVVALASPNNVRLQQVALVTTGGLWATSTGLTVGQGLQNRKLVQNSDAKMSLSISPLLSPKRQGVQLAGRF